MAADQLENLGKYQVEGVLGKGAMGVVYKASDPVIKRPVAIKTVRRELADQGESNDSSARFRQEARAAGNLSHSGIVAVYEYGEDDSHAFIAMEYVDGRSLRDYLAHGVAFDEGDAVYIGVQLLDALAHAHSRNVWHRDIKPGNIIITNEGMVKLADFGIARIGNSDLTQFGTVAGTPGYIAPEWYLGGTVDHRVDLFAAGVVLYQLLSGSAPFDGNVKEAMYKVCHEQPLLPSDVAPYLKGRKYDRVIMKALEKKPEDRFSSAAVFKAALLDAYGLPVATMISPGALADMGHPIPWDKQRAAVRNTTINTPSSMATPSQWSTAVLVAIEEKLTRFCGPVAKAMIRRAARGTQSVDELIQILADALDTEKERQAFLRSVEHTTAPHQHKEAMAGEATMVVSTSMATISPIDEATRERATKVMAEFFGPIARVMVKRAMAEAKSRDGFYLALAKGANNEKDEDRILRRLRAN
ncbi:MAG TPA: serine/threonine-protein kinase [Burkholderiales bacterium]|nr:serine/threonine-protein kinase [Burkholderiales bacterium]